MAAISTSIDGLRVAKKSYLTAVILSDQSTNISTGDHVKFNSTLISSGSDIALDGTTAYTSSPGASLGRFTLKGGKTYKLISELYLDTNQCIYQWYDVTNSVGLGTAGSAFGTNFATSDTTIPTAQATISPASDIVVEVRLINAGATNFIFSLGYGTAYGSHATIETIESSVLVVPSYGFAQVQYQVPNGNNGGSATTGSFQDRPLNTILYDNIGITLASNTINIPVGVYHLTGIAGFYKISNGRLRWYNSTTSTAMSAINFYAGPVDMGINISIDTVVTLTTPCDLKLQYRVSTSTSTTDLGVGNGFGDSEVHASVTIRRIG